MFHRTSARGDAGFLTVAELARAAGLSVEQALPWLTGAEEVVEELRFMLFLSDTLGLTLNEVSEHWPAITEYLRNLPEDSSK